MQSVCLMHEAVQYVGVGVMSLGNLMNYSPAVSAPNGGDTRSTRPLSHPYPLFIGVLF